MHMHFFSPPEIDQISRASKMSWLDVLLRLREAGLQTIPGGGAEILVDKIRKRISPKKIDSKSWMEIMRLAHSVGFKTTATMMFGHLESPSDIIEHMQLIQNLQSETGGLYAFIPWSFKPCSSPLSRIVKEYAGPDKYLRCDCCC